MKQLTWICVTAPLLALAINFADPTSTHADTPAPQLAPPPRPAPRPGIWQEMSTVVDGVTIRKIRDTTGGDYNVCYVASRQEEISPYKLDTYPAMLSISCVPEKRP